MHTQIGLGMDAYERLFKAVSQEIRQIRFALQSAEAKEKERVWTRNQPLGEIDESRLVDLAAGERNVFKRRALPDLSFGNFFQRHPKRIRFVMDCSRSMR
jgi:hypothetical protein